MPLRRLLTVLAALVLLLTARPGIAFSLVIGGAGGIEGSGKVIDQPRELSPFAEVLVEGPFDVTLQQGAGWRAVVHADDNIAPQVRTQVDGDRLRVGLAPGTSLRTRSGLRVTIEFQTLRALTLLGAGDARAPRLEAPILEATLRGGGDLRIDDLQVDALAVSITGSGDFTAAGRADKLGASLVGSGDLRVEDLRTRVAAVRIRGSGDARVDAAESLAVDIAGSGDVRYRGSPAITRKIKGSGEVAPLR